MESAKGKRDRGRSIDPFAPDPNDTKNAMQQIEQDRKRIVNKIYSDQHYRQGKQMDGEQSDYLEFLREKDNLQNTRLLISKLQDIKSANKVKKTLSKRYINRKGGYTRIIKAGFRYGDKAPMAVIEFVDRDVEAKKVDKKNKDIVKDIKAEKKIATS